MGDSETPEQKLEFLKSHGIKVETPADRAQGSTSLGSASNPLAQPPTGAKPITFKYVKLPADDSQSMEELSGEGFEAMDCMLTLLKPVFAGGSISDEAAKKAAKQQMGAQAELGDKGLSVLGDAAAEGSVEVFALVRPAASNNFCGVYIYLDEVGLLKSLPRNMRATAIASVCGFDNTEFYGDVYLSRTQTVPSPMRNVDFPVSDMESAAKWIKAAATENYDYGLSMRQVKDAIEDTNPRPKAAGVDKDAEGEGYKWVQTGEDLEVKVPIPEGTTKKDIKVKFMPQSLTVTIGGKETVNLKLYAKVNAEEGSWTVGKQELSIMLEKADEDIWPSISSA